MDELSNSFLYRRLSTSWRDICLLELLPGQTSCQLQARLSHRSLDQDPSYHALSYEQGDATRQTSISSLVRMGSPSPSILSERTCFALGD